MASIINRMAFTAGRLATKGIVTTGKGLWLAVKAPISTGAAFYEGCRAAVVEPVPVHLELAPEIEPVTPEEAPARKPRIRKTRVRKPTAASETR